jgi:CubicO group peptidase (beta-lactamase class C family)
MEDLVSNVLPGVLADSIARKIKIQHLLTHTSGLGDFLFTPEMSQKSKENFRCIADYLPGLADDTLLFEPGTHWSYSNTGFLLLGAIVERVSGTPYEDYVKKHIYQPAGMVSTFFPELDNVNEGLADTYEKDYFTGKPVFHNTRYYQVIKGTPAGGGFSTCTDIFNFMQALAAGKLLKPGTVRMMQSAKPEINSPDYGYGTQVFDENSYGHTGSGPGTDALVKAYRDKNLTAVILCNQNSGSYIVVRNVLELF